MFHTKSQLFLIELIPGAVLYPRAKATGVLKRNIPIR